VDSSALGYIFDFLAGIFIIRSIVLRSKRHIEVEASTLWDGNPLLYESQLKAFWDGWLGVVTLFIGLILHLYHFEFPLSTGLLTIGITILLYIVAIYLLNKRIATEVRKVYNHYDKVKDRARGKGDMSKVGLKK